MLAVCLGLGFVLMAQGCHNYVEANKDYGEFQYQSQDGDVWLTLSTGKKVKMHFRENSVKIYESHRYDDTVYEIIAFIQAYGEEKGYKISRGKAELVGEFKLHNRLYSIGYKRAQTQHSDIEYTADSRWYVNWASNFLGWCG